MTGRPPTRCHNIAGVNCEEARTAVRDRLRGSFVADGVLEGHLGACPACRAWEDQITTARARVDGLLGSAPPPAAMLAAVQARIVARSTRLRWGVGLMGGLLLLLNATAGTLGSSAHGEAVLWETAVAVGLLALALWPVQAVALRAPVAAVGILVAMVAVSELLGLTSTGAPTSHVLAATGCWSALRLGRTTGAFLRLDPR